jgi:hypothetical protein
MHLHEWMVVEMSTMTMQWMHQTTTSPLMSGGGSGSDATETEAIILRLAAMANQGKTEEVMRYVSALPDQDTRIA